MQTDDGVVEAMLFVCHQTVDHCCVYTVATCGEKSYTMVIMWLRCVHVYTHFNNVTKTEILHVLIQFRFNLNMTLAVLM